MRSLAVSHSDTLLRLLPHEAVEQFHIDEVPLWCAMIVTPAQDFDAAAPENRSRVLVRQKAFSCNYRDKGLIFRGLQSSYKHSYLVIGSEFAGEVVAIGADVTGVRIGDRVMGDNHYLGTGDASQGYREGVPTNAASQEYQSFHLAKLRTIPPEMSDAVAAAFSIGAQTAYSMVRKLELTPGANVLVTAARSNTSLFSICALKKHGVNVYVTSSSSRFEPELRALGVRELFVVDPMLGWAKHEHLQVLARAIGGFDGVIDPFFDLHLNSAVAVLAAGGRYVTCGRYDQYLDLIGRESPYGRPDLRHVVLAAILKNVQIIGNCVGLTSDLDQAIADYVAGDFSVTIDAVYAGQQIGVFLDRSFNAGDRFGKVVYCFD
jgi:NADPH:quinone reductase-like Zn-dependent oxidoreductase